MVKDPKQIITPFAFSIHPELLGLPLATPKRRLLALFLDLIIASILTNLGSFLLAFLASGIFFWLAIRTKGLIWWRNLLRYSIAGFASILVFSFSFYFLTDSSKDDQEQLTESQQALNATIDSSSIATNSEVDFTELTKKFLEVDYTNEEDIERLGQELEAEFGVQEERIKQDNEALNSKFFESSFVLLLTNFSRAIQQKDSLAIDSLQGTLYPIIASKEIAEFRSDISSLKSQKSDLQDRNEELREVIDNPTFSRTLKATAEDFGLTFGWIGVYFVLTLALFKGRTLGKKLLGIQVVRLNNKPIGIWYSFERFGGYAAGIATGLLGFFQIFWDPNRQAIHDKIAGTVVIDLREKKLKKFKHLKEEILNSENLLSDL